VDLILRYLTGTCLFAPILIETKLIEIKKAGFAV